MLVPAFFALAASTSLNPQEIEYYKPYYQHFVCDVQGATANLYAKVTPWPADGGVTWSPGVNPDITGAWAWGVKFYVEGRVEVEGYTYYFDGDEFGAMFWMNQNGERDRFDAHFEQRRDGFVIKVDPIRQNRYAEHSCRLVR